MKKTALIIISVVVTLVLGVFFFLKKKKSKPPKYIGSKKQQPGQSKEKLTPGEPGKEESPESKLSKQNGDFGTIDDNFIITGPIDTNINDEIENAQKNGPVNQGDAPVQQEPPIWGNKPIITPKPPSQKPPTQGRELPYEPPTRPIIAPKPPSQKPPTQGRELPYEPPTRPIIAPKPPSTPEKRILNSSIRRYVLNNKYCIIDGTRYATTLYNRIQDNDRFTQKEAQLIENKVKEHQMFVYEGAKKLDYTMRDKIINDGELRNLMATRLSSLILEKIKINAYFSGQEQEKIQEAYSYAKRVLTPEKPYNPPVTARPIPITKEPISGEAPTKSEPPPTVSEPPRLEKPILKYELKKIVYYEGEKKNNLYDDVTAPMIKISTKKKNEYYIYDKIAGIIIPELNPKYQFVGLRPKGSIETSEIDFDNITKEQKENISSEQLASEKAKRDKIRIYNSNQKRIRIAGVYRETPGMKYFNM